MLSSPVTPSTGSLTLSHTLGPSVPGLMCQ